MRKPVGASLFLGCDENFFLFLLSDFLSQSFTSQRTAGEGRGHFFNSWLPPPLASQTLRH